MCFSTEEAFADPFCISERPIVSFPLQDPPPLLLPPLLHFSILVDPPRIFNSVDAGNGNMSARKASRPAAAMSCYGRAKT